VSRGAPSLSGHPRFFSKKAKGDLANGSTADEVRAVNSARDLLCGNQNSSVKLANA
jgi:hypothetical protein